MVAHVLYVVLRVQHHNVVVNSHLLRLQIQNVDAAAESRRDDCLLVVAEVAARNGRLTVSVNQDWLVCIPDIPDGNLAILSHRSNLRTGIVHNCLVDFARVIVQVSNALTRIGVPNLHRSVHTTRDHPLPVLQVVQRPESIVMTSHFLETLVGVGIPQHDRLVVGSTSILGAIYWINSQGVH